MRFSRWLYLLTFFVLPQSYLSAQGNADIKFGKITAGEFNLSVESFDPSVISVKISEIGSAWYEGNDVLGMRVIFRSIKKKRNELINFQKKSQ